MMQMLVLAKKLITSFFWAGVETTHRHRDGRCRGVMHWHNPLMVGIMPQTGLKNGKANKKKKRWKWEKTMWKEGERLKVETNVGIVFFGIEPGEKNWGTYEIKEKPMKTRNKEINMWKRQTNKKRNSPKKQYLTENQPADRTPPMRTPQDLKSQHAVVHSPSSWKNKNKYIFMISFSFKSMHSLTIKSGISDLQTFITHLQHSSNQRAM